MTEDAQSLQTIDRTVQLIRERWIAEPEIAVILGTGLGAFVEGLDIEQTIPYSELPAILPATAIGHVGELVCGCVDSIPMIALRGRSHCYEGATIEQITSPIRVLQQLGITTLFVSCAAGGLAPGFQPGELMLIEDHVDFLQRQLQRSELLRNPNRAMPYDQSLNALLRQVALELGIGLKAGSYVAVSGPNYETRAEMRFYRILADAIGMSTVPEVTLAHQLGLRVCGLATITNLCNPDALAAADGSHVVTVATEAEPRFRQLMLEVIRRLAER